MAEDVSVEVKMDGNGPKLGADAQLKIVVKNQSSQPRRATLHSQVAVMYYTGVLKGTIKKDQMPVELLPDEGWISAELSLFVIKLAHWFGLQVLKVYLNLSHALLCTKQQMYKIIIL